MELKSKPTTFNDFESSLKFWGKIPTSKYLTENSFITLSTGQKGQSSRLSSLPHEPKKLYSWAVLMVW